MFFLHINGDMQAASKRIDTYDKYFRSTDRKENGRKDDLLTVAELTRRINKLHDGNERDVLIDIRAHFNTVDKNGNGVSEAEFIAYLERTNDIPQLERLISNFRDKDDNGNNSLNRAEFGGSQEDFQHIDSIGRQNNKITIGEYIAHELTSNPSTQSTSTSTSQTQGTSNNGSQDPAGPNLEGRNFSNIVLNNMNWKNANLRRAFFSNVSLNNSNLENANAEGVNFVHSSLFNVKLDNANLRMAGFTFTNLFDVSMKGVNMESAIISDAILNDTSFEGANLKNVAVYNSTLNNTSFKDANLTGIRFGNSTLTNTNFEGAYADVNGTRLTGDALIEHLRSQGAIINQGEDITPNDNPLNDEVEARIPSVRSAIENYARVSANPNASQSAKNAALDRIIYSSVPDDLRSLVALAMDDLRPVVKDAVDQILSNNEVGPNGSPVTDDEALLVINTVLYTPLGPGLPGENDEVFPNSTPPGSWGHMGHEDWPVPAPPGVFTMCLSPHTKISTLDGRKRVFSIKAGDIVLTDGGMPVRVKKINKKKVVNHKVLKIKFDDGSVFEISGNHPTADGRLLKDLVVGDILDGRKVVSIKTIKYRYKYTYDILPDSPTGNYYANGILIGSTLSESCIQSQISEFALVGSQ